MALLITLNAVILVWLVIYVWLSSRESTSDLTPVTGPNPDPAPARDIDAASASAEGPATALGRVLSRKASSLGILGGAKEVGDYKRALSNDLQVSCLIVPALWALVAYATIYATTEHEALVAAAALFVTSLLDLKCWSLVSSVNTAMVQVGQSAGILITAFAVQGAAGKFQRDLRIKALYYTVPIVVQELFIMVTVIYQTFKVWAWQSAFLPRLLPPKVINLSSQFASLLSKLSNEGQSTAAAVIQAFIDKNATDVHDICTFVVRLTSSTAFLSCLYAFPIMCVSTHELTGIQRKAMGMNIGGLLATFIMICLMRDLVPDPPSDDELEKKARKPKGKKEKHDDSTSLADKFGITGNYASCFDNTLLVQNVTSAAYVTLMDCGKLDSEHDLGNLNEAKALDAYNRCLNLTHQVTRAEMIRVAPCESTEESYSKWKLTVSDLRNEGMGEADCILLASLIIITHIAREQLEYQRCTLPV